MLEEFRNDYNQTHFVRNKAFKEAADKIQGPTRKIFVEFLERSCTAEFSGFLLYKELGRRLKDVNPVVAEIFTLLSRDEARHAGFINKALSDFNLALDLGFLTKNRSYTFFKPKFIIYATYLRRARGFQNATVIEMRRLPRSHRRGSPAPVALSSRSEKIGYWRYISIYRHLQRNPDNLLYPLFEYFENWCQDESRHGGESHLQSGWGSHHPPIHLDSPTAWPRQPPARVSRPSLYVPPTSPPLADFLAAVLKARPELLNDWVAKLWCRFFCLSVYATMYLNDHQRSSFYESIGLDTKAFNQHVIIETNRTTARIFPAVCDVESPEFFERLDRVRFFHVSDARTARVPLALPCHGFDTRGMYIRQHVCVWGFLCVGSWLSGAVRNGGLTRPWVGCPQCVEMNTKLSNMGSNASIFERLPLVAGIAGELLACFFMKPVEMGSVEMTGDEASMVY